jgi:predicted nucleic acid-binding protein
MSFLIDSNILIYAADATLDENKRAIDVIQQAGRSKEVWCISWQNIFEFLTVVTNPRAFQGKVLQMMEAEAFVRKILAAPNLKIIQEGQEHWAIFQDIVGGLPGTFGPFLHDCHLATLLKEHGVKRVFTADKGFSRFSFLSVCNPFTDKTIRL